MRRDPRDQYDDLITMEDEEYVSSDDFESQKRTDTARSGWAIGALVFDSDDRILLVDNYWADGWIVPSGGVKPGESLSDAVVREVNEEGGVDVTPVRPHAITDSTTVNEATGESFDTSFVLFEATAETTTIPDELGESKDEVSDAEWFDTLPENVYNRNLTKRVFHRSIETDRDGV